MRFQFIWEDFSCPTFKLPQGLGYLALWYEEVAESLSILINRWFAILFHVVGVHIYGKRRDMPHSTSGVGGYVSKEHIPSPRQFLLGVPLPGTKQRHIQPILQNLCVISVKYHQVGVQEIQISAVLPFLGFTMVYRFTPGSTDGCKLKENAGCGLDLNRCLHRQRVCQVCKSSL